MLRKIFRLIYSSLFLLFLLEVIQKYHVCLHYASHLEILRTLAFMLLLVCLAAAILSIIFWAVTTALKRFGVSKASTFSIIELICIIAFLIVYVYSLSLLLRSPIVFTYLWKYKIGPLVVISLVLFSWLKFRRQTTAIYGNILEAVWIPLLGLSLIAAIWIGSTFLTHNVFKQNKLSDLIASLKHSSSYFHRPNIIFVTFDGLSAVDMSLYGYERKTTPYLEEIAKDSIVFENMYANYVSTTPSVLSIFTSKYPWTHKVYSSGGGTLRDKREENITELLREYTFVSTVSAPYAQPIIIGAGARFEVDSNSTKSSYLKAMKKLDVYFYRFSHNIIPIDELPIFSKIFPPRPQLEEMILSPIDEQERDSPQITQIREYSSDAEKTFNKALEDIDGVQPPFFHWIHVFPPNPHAAKPGFTYPPEPFLYTFLSKDIEVPLDEEIWVNGAYPLSRQGDVDKMRARYDESILYVDSVLADFLEQLKEKRLFDDSIIIISSDHGESFEKGWRGHASEALFEPVIHIPLIIHLPNQKQGKRVEVFAEHVDIAPTILDLLGKSIPSWMEGETLLPYIEEDSLQTDKPKFSMSNYNKKISISVLKNGNKMISMNGIKYFYDLTNDPKELRTISYEESDKDTWKEIEEIMDEHLDKIKQR